MSAIDMKQPPTSMKPGSLDQICVKIGDGLMQAEELHSLGGEGHLVAVVT